MKVCHITITHDVFDTRIFKKECVSLYKSGYQVVLIAPHDKNEHVDGVEIVPIFRWRSFKERIFTAPKEVVRIATEIDADLYHFHDPELLPAMASFARRTKKNVIWDAHENYGDTIFRLNSLKIKPISWLGAKWFSWKEIRTAKKLFSGVVTITDVMAEKYRSHGISTCVLANYADLEQFEYSGQTELSEKPRLISSGSHFRGRAVVESAESFKLIRKKMDAEMVFSGKFSSTDLLHNVKTILTEEDPDGDNWQIEGAVSFNYLINVALPKAWVGLVLFDLADPNNRNGLPNRFFECWANGVPVITTKGTQVANLVEAINGGVVINDNSPEEIANGFEKIARNKKLRNAMSKNAYEAVKNKFNWQSNFKDLELFYVNILNE